MFGGCSAGGGGVVRGRTPPGSLREGQPQPLAPAARPGERWEPHRAVGMPAGLCIPQQHMGRGERRAEVVRGWHGAVQQAGRLTGAWSRVRSQMTCHSCPCPLPQPSCLQRHPTAPADASPLSITQPCTETAFTPKRNHVLCERGRRQTLGEQLRRGLLGTDLGSRGHVHGRN